MTRIINYVPNISNGIYLSVIVTFYNQENFVDKCLKSIISQCTKYKYEIIVVDDCSSDNTTKLIQNWISKYSDVIKLFKSDNNDNCYDQIARVSKCRLLGIKNSSGKYLCFLDGDDFFACNEKFEKQIDFLEKNQDCCACLSAYMSTFEGNDISIKKIPAKHILSRKQYIKNYYLPAATMIYRNVAFNCYEDNFDDNSISFALMQKNKMCYLNEVTFCHYKTAKSSWLGKNDNQKTIAIIKNIDDAITFSNINKNLIYKRHCQFIFDLYHKRKVLKKPYMMYLRTINSKLLYNLIYYNNISLFGKIITKYSILKLLLYSKIHAIFGRKMISE